MRPLPAMIVELAELVRSPREDPSTAGERVGMMAALLRARWFFRRCDLGVRVRAWRSVRVVAEGQITLGDRVQFWAGPLAQELVSLPGAQLRLGDDSVLEAGASLRAAQEIRVGARCMFGSLALVRDEENGRIAQVTIADDVTIGDGAIICPGVAIGRGSVIGAGSVVRADVPASSLAIGNPAVVRPLRPGASAR